MGVQQILAKNLRDIYRLKKLRQVDIAEAVGVSQTAVTKWLSGKSGIELETLVKLCRYLGVTLDQACGIEPLDNALSKGELHLINIYRVLDEEGQHKLTDYADDLQASGRYDPEKNDASEEIS